jgi:hypothetical protein
VLAIETLLREAGVSFEQDANGAITVAVAPPAATTPAASAAGCSEH